MAKIVAFSSIQLDRFYSPLGKSVNISVQNRLSKSGKFSNIINENNMSALNNYLEKNNASVYIEDLGGDFFHDVKFHVFKRGKPIQLNFRSVLRVQKRILQTACALCTKMLKMR